MDDFLGLHEAIHGGINASVLIIGEQRRRPIYPRRALGFCLPVWPAKRQDDDTPHVIVHRRAPSEEVGHRPGVSSNKVECG